MSLDNALFYYFLTLTFILTPGPGVFAIISKSLSNGSVSAFTIAAAMIIFDLLYLILACYGLSKIAETAPLLFLAIRFIGAAYLIYLGFKMFKETSLSLEKSEEKSSENFSHTFMQGIFIGASNPKVILFYLALLPSFFNLENLSILKLIVIILLTIVAAITGVSILALGAKLIKKLVRSKKGVKTINSISGSLMILAGIYLIVEYWY
jgi:threonine/homoserine/homoserine lactone efflux protein